MAPIVAMMGTVFFTFRHIIDAHLLLSLHKTEIDSGAKLFQKAISFLCMSLMCYHFYMILYFYFNDLMTQLYIVSFMLCVTITCMFLIRAEKFSVELLKTYSREK